jgi:hypothetical protein
MTGDAGIMPTKPVLVVYAYIDGAHFFTSLNVKGLCAAHANLEVAYKEVSIQLGHLLSKEPGKPVHCEPEEPVEEFERWLEAQKQARPTRLENAAMAKWALARPGSTASQ